MHLKKIATAGKIHILTITREFCHFWLNNNLYMKRKKKSYIKNILVTKQVHISAIVANFSDFQ